MKLKSAVVVCLLAVTPAAGEVVSDTAVQEVPVRTAITAQDRARERASRVKDLAAIRAKLAEAEARKARLEKELELKGRDKTAVARALLESSKRSAALEADIAEIQTRLDTLHADRERIRISLRGRRAMLIEVIAALQRMGTNPPPALLVKPDDALGAVRSALLLGAVVPQMRGQAEALELELEALARMEQAIAAEKAEQADALQQLAEDEERLNLLAQNKAEGVGSSAADVQQAVAEVTGLAQEAQSVESLIAALDATIAEAGRVASAVKEADLARSRAELERLAKARARLEAGNSEASLRESMLDPMLDPNRRQPAVAFERTRGLLPLPVSGRPVFGFGDMLAVGSTRRIESPNVAYATAPGAVVRSPADGRVVYAGPFRSFGHVLILDVGSSYMIVLSGLGRVDVAVQSFVVSGQPIGVMGATAARRATVIAQKGVPLGLNAPVLYVEFRKGGRPVDPAPWWAAKRASAQE